MNVDLAPPRLRALGNPAWRRALASAMRCVIALLGLAIVVQAFLVVQARPQDLVTGIHGMADLIRRAMPPDFSQLPATLWPALQTVDIALFGTLVGIYCAAPRASRCREYDAVAFCLLCRARAHRIYPGCA
jgi:phosphonate transport system permease protein